MAKSGNMNMRVTPVLAEALHRAATDDNRSDRDKATLIVNEWLLEHGYLRTREYWSQVERGRKQCPC